MMTIAAHLEYVWNKDRVIEQVVADNAVTELSFILEDINALKVGHEMQASRDAVGDVCYLLIRLLADAPQREALLETFEGVRDAALQQEDVGRITVKVIKKKRLRKVTNYYFRARAVLAHPAQKYGIDITSLDSSSGMIL